MYVASQPQVVKEGDEKARLELLLDRDKHWYGKSWSTFYGSETTGVQEGL
jgi:hypothetical protein